MKRLHIYLLIALAITALTAPTAPATESVDADRSKPLTASEADSLARMHYHQAIQEYADSMREDWYAGTLYSDGYKMPFACYVTGEMPERGYPLYISLHGGGGTTAAENDQQWENQKRLYGDVEGVYFVPRAPVDEWNMWHQGYMDDFLRHIIVYGAARLGVDTSRVYLLGYSAGGDGVYNLAARLSDRFAAAAAMAGHPGDAQVENLRNLSFAIYMGAEDTAYNRSALAMEWLRSYEMLSSVDPAGFGYNINIYDGKGHWMDGLDAAAIGWLAGYRRASSPDRVVWIQDDVLHTRKYNLEVSNPKRGDRVEQRVDRNNNTIYIETTDYDEVTVWLDDYMVNLDKPVTILFNGREAFSGVVTRLESNIVRSIVDRFDAEYLYWGVVTVSK